MKINGLHWQAIHETLPSDNEEATLGLNCPAELTIKIQHGLSEELERRTFIHELVHAIAFSFGMHLQDEEEVAEFVSCYFDLIRKIVRDYDRGQL